MGKWESRVEWWNDTTGASISSFQGEWEFDYGYYGYCVMDNFKGVPNLPFAGTQNGPAIRGYDVQNNEWHMTYIPVNQPVSKLLKKFNKETIPYITTEELHACTTCNACVEACPVLINPLDIIVELRRNLILDQASAPEPWSVMFTNIENNGAPWQFSASDRANWIEEI